MVSKLSRVGGHEVGDLSQQFESLFIYLKVHKGTYFIYDSVLKNMILFSDKNPKYKCKKSVKVQVLKSNI